METKLKKRIDKGVIWLNKRFGKSWLRKISLKTLNMSGNKACICGQLFGNFMKVFTSNGGDMTTYHTVTRGFYLTGQGESFDLLTELWVERIKKERKKLR